MPQFIAPIVSAIAGTSLTAGAVTFISNAIALIGTVALSSWQKNKAASKARAQFEASQVDRLNNIMTAIGPREMVLGRARKGGTVFFRAATGAFQNTFVMCIALAAHEIDAVEQIYFNNEPVNVDGEGRVTSAPYSVAEKISRTQTFTEPSITLDFDPVGPDPFGAGGGVKVTTGIPPYEGFHEVPYTISGRTVTLTEAFKPFPWVTQVSYQYQGLKTFAFVKTHLGGAGQQAEPELMALFPGVWTAEHRAAGVAYIYCRFAYDKTAFPSGIPKVTARIRGARMYDPRSNTFGWSENPALMMRNILTHPQFGKRTALTGEEDIRIAAAAAACDVATNYAGEWVSMFRGGLVVQFGAPARDVLDDLAQAMGGMWAFASGEFYVRAGSWRAPVMELTDSVLAVVQRDNSGSESQEPITINVHKPRNDKFNVVTPRIWDQNNAYALTAITPMKAASLIADDGAELVQETTMPAVFYAYQALHVAGMMIRDARDPLTVTLPVKLRAYPLELFDSIWLTLARYGWPAKEFIILGRSLMTGGRMQFTLKETAAAIFQRDAGFPPQGYADNTKLPSPWNIQPPRILSISSGEDELVTQTDGTLVNGVRVTWAPTQDESIRSGGNIELMYRVLPDGAWVSVMAPGDATEVKFTGVQDLAMILVMVRSRNTLATSGWSGQELHQVIGKTEPPPNIENLTISGSVLSWTMPRRVPDLAGFVFRFQYGNNLDWNSAAPLHNEGLVPVSPWEPENRPGGVVTIMGKAQDTSGNQSLATANIVMNLGDPPIANVVEEWDFKALGWPFEIGEQSGWTFVAGDPAADAQDSFYGSDDQTFYTGDTDPFYDLSAYGQMVYVTKPVSVNAALAGSIMTLVATTLGVDLHIDYRLAGPGSFYGPDTASFYGPDTEPRYGLPGAWMAWPGQLIANNDAYQFRVTIGAGTTRGVLAGLVLTIDAPDLQEVIPDLPISAAGTVIPYTKNFTSIKAVIATLQANSSGARTVVVDKTNPLAPKIAVLNSAGVAVAGATVDIVIQGY